MTKGAKAPFLIVNTVNPVLGVFWIISVYLIQSALFCFYHLTPLSGELLRQGWVYYPLGMVRTLTRSVINTADPLRTL